MPDNVQECYDYIRRINALLSHKTGGRPCICWPEDLIKTALQHLKPDKVVMLHLKLGFAEKVLAAANDKTLKLEIGSCEEEKPRSIDGFFRVGVHDNMNGLSMMFVPTLSSAHAAIGLECARDLAGKIRYAGKYIDENTVAFVGKLGAGRAILLYEPKAVRRGGNEGLDFYIRPAERIEAAVRQFKEDLTDRFMPSDYSPAMTKISGYLSEGMKNYKAPLPEKEWEAVVARTHAAVVGKEF